MTLAVVIGIKALIGVAVLITMFVDKSTEN
jgi:hypothetical protein